MYLALLLLALILNQAPGSAPPAASTFSLVCSHAGHGIGCDAPAQCESCSMTCRKADPSLPLAEECSLIIDSFTLLSADGAPIFMFKPSTPYASVELMPQINPRVLFVRVHTRGKPSGVFYGAYEVKNSTLAPEPSSLTCIDAASGLISGAAGPGIACAFRNEFFETSVPVIYRFEKHGFTLLNESTDEFNVRAMSAPDVNGSLAQPMHRISPVAPATASIQLCASHDASSSCEAVEVQANTPVKLLGSWAALADAPPHKKTPGQLHLKLDAAHAWLHIDVNGSRGWIHEEKDLRAIGLPIKQPEAAATAAAPAQNQPLD